MNDSKLVRDLNCLTDPDRSTRLRALNRLAKSLPELSSPQLTEVLQQFLQVLVNLIIDPTDSCRESCENIWISILPRVDNIQPIVSPLLSTISNRIQGIPSLETTEEIRLKLIQTISIILHHPSIQQNPSVVIPHSHDLNLAFAKALVDSFPDIRRDTCGLIEYTSVTYPELIRPSLDQLLKPLLSNLSHQHSKTRQITLKVFQLHEFKISVYFSSCTCINILVYFSS